MRPDYLILYIVQIIQSISRNKHILIHLLVYRNVGLVSRGRSTCACGVSCVEERTHSHRLAAVRVRGDTAGAAVRRRWERALTWPDKRGPGGRELVAEKRRAPAPPRGVAGRIVLASSRVVRACRTARMWRVEPGAVTVTATARRGSTGRESAARHGCIFLYM